MPVPLQNVVADRRFYAFRSWPVYRCDCGRNVVVKPVEHFCAVGVECRAGCGHLVSVRGDGAVLGWMSGMPHICPTPLSSQ